MNEISLKSVRELLSMKFFIPDYQRGYRWSRQQVKDLLEDIADFSCEHCYKAGEFYCLQPLVVRQMKVEEKEKCNLDANDTWYEVIDGQQRLTTIFLILTAVRKDHDINQSELPTELYELKYQRDNNNEAGFLHSIADLQKIDSTQVDHYYMSEAFFFIQQWFKETKANKGDFCNTLLRYEPQQGNTAQDNANNVRFIWYESMDEDPIKVFTRLNIGKISLTNAELIKALLLNRSNFHQNDEFSTKLRQMEIASEWDKIEYALQKEDFWLFLHEPGYSLPTRIDFIFDLICAQNQLGLVDSQMQTTGEDEYKTFRYFNAYFKQQGHDVEYCWRIIKSYYQTFMEWYDDLQLYHYIGYLIVESKKHGVAELIKKWNEMGNKRSFLCYLKNEIKTIIKGCPSLDAQYANDGSDKGRCKPILLFHNIQTVINQNQNEQNNERYQLATFYKFPFHLYKLEKWDVEHINSSTENQEDDAETQAEWLVNVYLGVSEAIQEQIIDYFEAPTEKRSNLFSAIKERVPVPEAWSDEEKNQLWNYTLLDASTNRSYGNAIFSAKRRIIISKDKGKLIPIPKLSKDKQLALGEEEERTSSFVPPCTRQVFMKYYSPTAGNNNYWTKETDACAYKADIENCIKKLEK